MFTYEAFLFEDRPGKDVRTPIRVAGEILIPDGGQETVFEFKIEGGTRYLRSRGFERDFYPIVTIDEKHKITESNEKIIR